MIYKDVEEYHDNGNLKCKYTCRFRERHGLFQTWFENGQKSLECHHRNNNYEGLFQRWWDRVADNTISDRGQKMVEC